MGEGIDSLHDVSKITRGCGMGVNSHARNDRGRERNREILARVTFIFS
jgi:hypothetical protein